MYLRHQLVKDSLPLLIVQFTAGLADHSDGFHSSLCSSKLLVIHTIRQLGLANLAFLLPGWSCVKVQVLASSLLCFSPELFQISDIILANYFGLFMTNTVLPNMLGNPSGHLAVHKHLKKLTLSIILEAKSFRLRTFREGLNPLDRLAVPGAARNMLG